MKKETFVFAEYRRTNLPAYLWTPDGEVKAVLQITHGMTEHMGRYEAFAEYLVPQGIAVAGFDLRGHGRNPGDPEVASFGEGGWAASIEDMRLFYNLLQKDKLYLPTQDTEAEMYEMLMDTMEEHGLRQYEISNFAKPGFESRHNLVYWNNEEYYGFGAGAHGYVNGERVSNHGPLKKYMEPLKQGELPRLSVHPVPLNERMEEEMFLGLRKTKGVSLERFRERYNLDAGVVFKDQIEELLERGLLENKDGFLSLTRKGKLLGNEVFQSFIGAG